MRAGFPGLRLVAVDDGDTVVGWVAASAVSSRPAYRGVVEHSVYIDRAARGQGLGRLLLDAFIAAAEAAGVWTIQSSIFPENAASLRLHEATGFRVVGRQGTDRARGGRSPRRAVAGHHPHRTAKREDQWHERRDPPHLSASRTDARHDATAPASPDRGSRRQ